MRVCLPCGVKFTVPEQKGWKLGRGIAPPETVAKGAQFILQITLVEDALKVNPSDDVPLELPFISIIAPFSRLEPVAVLAHVMGVTEFV